MLENSDVWGRAEMLSFVVEMFPNMNLACSNYLLFYPKNSQPWLRSWDGRDSLQYAVCTLSPCSGDSDRFLEEI